MSSDPNVGPARRFRGRRRRLAFALCLVWIAFIFATSCTVVRPQEFFDWMHTHILVDDGVFRYFQAFWGLSWFAIVKGWHAIEFAILLVLCVAALARWTGRRTTGIVVLAMVFCLGFAISDEWHQTLVPDRFGTVTDVLIDAIGVLVAGFVLLRRLRVRDRGGG